MRTLYKALDFLHTRITPYDRVTPLDTHPMRGLASSHKVAVALLLLFVALGALLVFGGYIDNKPTTASTGLVTAHRMVTMNPGGWFSEGIWWRGKQTPTPLPFTLHGAFFGYTIRGILFLHVCLGALAGALLYRITARRFGAGTGLLAMLLYLTAPLTLYVNLSGWTFVWATLFLLASIDLLDKAVLAKRIPYYLLAGLFLGCAGMSRPENYAVAALVLLFVQIPLRYRILFLLLAFAYPLAQYLHNNVYLGDRSGLRILDDSRSDMTYLSLFREWFGSIHRNIFQRNFASATQWLLVPAVLLLGLPRHRFLTGVLAYFTVAFFAAYAMRRISFNHEGYYYAHVTLTMPFLAALLGWLATRVTAFFRHIGVPTRRAMIPAALLLAIGLSAQAWLLRDAYRDRLLFRVPEPVREVRDFLQRELQPDDRLVLDYFREVSWMIAEVEGPEGRDLYYYESNPSKISRPRVNATRKDIAPEEQSLMNTWVGTNYALWHAQKPPRFIVTQSDAAWARERDRPRAMGHYRMYSLRPALGIDVPGGHLLTGTVVFENEEFVILERKADDHNKL